MDIKSVQEGVKSPFIENIEEYVVVFLDIDNIRYINDTFGHSIGDKFLSMFGNRLSQIVGEEGIVFKYNDGEFVILFHKNEKELIDKKIQFILNESNKVFKEEDYEILSTASIGVYTPNSNDKIDDIIKKAYIAMYQGKTEGKGNYKHFTNSIEEKIKRKTLLTKELTKSIERNYEGLYLIYQPIYNVVEKKIDEAEALMRWKNQELGEISPAEFIPIAEEMGLIRKLGYWLIKKVLRQIKEWNKEGLNLKIAINISPQQVAEKDFLKKIKETIHEEDIDFRQIKLEITETQILKLDEQRFKDLTELINLGVDIALDDFGEGYSSIKSLVFSPITEVKIDKIFIDYIHQDEKIQKLISSIIYTVHGLGYKVIAEGVEYKEQFDKLLEYGCDKIQGYYIERPIDEKKIVEFIKGFHNTHYAI